MGSNVAPGVAGQALRMLPANPIDGESLNVGGYPRECLRLLFLLAGARHGSLMSTCPAWRAALVPPPPLAQSPWRMLLLAVSIVGACDIVSAPMGRFKGRGRGGRGRRDEDEDFDYRPPVGAELLREQCQQFW